MTSGNISIRVINSNKVLMNIYYEAPISRSRISSNTGINKASVSEITRDLINLGVIEEVGTGSSTKQGGRKPIFLQINESFGLVIGIDIGVNSIRYAISSLNNKIIEKGRITVENNKDYLKTVDSLITKSLSKYEHYSNGILSGVISIQGSVHDNNILFTPNYNVKELETMIKKFKIPIYFGNEANLAAIAHHRYSEDEFVASITIRTGIGAGIIINGEIYEGFSGSAGEIGHTIVVPGGKKCPCGNKGCLEMYASERSILAEYRKVKSNDLLTIEDLYLSIDEGDKSSIEIVRQSAEYLSIAIKNFISIFDISKIIISSDLTDNISILIPEIKKHLTGIFNKNIIIETSEFGKYSSAIGATYLSVQITLDFICLKEI